jgi:hypothetical protein
LLPAGTATKAEVPTIDPPAAVATAPAQATPSVQPGATR